MFVHQQPHQFRDRNGRVRIIELHGKFRVESLQSRKLLQVDPNHILQRARRKKILLLQPQLFSLQLFIIRIKHLRDVLGSHLVQHRAVIIAGVEGLKIE